ncbi:MAG: chromosome segregation protein SMC [Firmicutes bacterium]|nr:chromosome segregation protein SMC [Bacillota bacterium]
MHLKRLEIHGFKSFADRINLVFKPGITAIVGPNGSGKSNIADSLRWVMGEANLRNLRGTKYEDVIFSGSDDRKPLGMADVTLVLDNSDQTLPLDYTEVAVTRRVYRSGESEFLINRVPVRLKDIQELFFDTGLGKEAYSVISQGKIDAILSVRPEDRRSIFEEAAGIMRYKVKKNLTIKKLGETENNILRIQDLLAELRKQLDPLADQAEKATLYLEIRNGLKAIEINHAYQEMRAIERTLKDLTGEEQVKQQTLAALKAEEEKLAQEMFAVKRQANELETQIQTRQKLLMDGMAQRERAAGELNLFTERKRSLENRQQELTILLTTQREKIGALEQKQAQLQQSTAGIAREKEELAAEVKRLEEVLTDKEGQIKAVRAELAAKKGLYTEKLEANSRLKQQISEEGAQKGFRQEREAELRAELDLINHELAETQAQGQALQAKLEELRKEAESSKAEERRLAGELEKSRTYLAQRSQKNQELRERLHGLESKITVLSEMERSHQGYFHGVKALLEAKQEPFHREIHGVVADLIRPEPGYELALEVALGSALQNLVINHHRHAGQAITYLKQHRLGRATFLPLNLIEEKPDRISEWKGILAQFNSKPATEAVFYDGQYRAIVSYLLSGTLVAPDLKTAVELAEKTGKRFRVVTLEGEVIAPGGAITGGNLEHRQAGLLSRKGEIRRLTREKQDLLAFLQRGLTEEHKLQTEIQELSRLYEEKRNRGQEIAFLQNSTLKDLEALKINHQKAFQQRAFLENALLKIEEELSTKDLTVNQLQERQRLFDAELGLIAQEIGSLEQREGILIQEREQSLRELSVLSSRLAGIEQEWVGKQENLDEYTITIGELRVEAVRREKELVQLKEELASLEAEKKQLETEVAQAALSLAAEETELERMRNAWQEALDKANQMEIRWRDLQKTESELLTELHRLELQLNRIKINQDNLTANLNEAYGEDWAQEVQPAYVLPPHPRQEILRLKTQLKALEPVNLQAIEEYQNLKERVDFLSRQLADLTEARESLTKVITEIEKTIKKRFTITFEQIRKEFIDLFEQLFSGGKADLQLLDPDQPLESGIEIFAQPPGKRLQNLSLLSGGERAMTAIALLFAIFRVKPSPFCILDEIDATLDETNVQRFTELLKLFSKDLQFIVITHRRGTMEVADVLYGVTMEEKGISKLISLELKKQAS